MRIIGHNFEFYINISNSLNKYLLSKNLYLKYNGVLKEIEKNTGFHLIDTFNFFNTSNPELVKLSASGSQDLNGKLRNLIPIKNVGSLDFTKMLEDYKLQKYIGEENRI